MNHQDRWAAIALAMCPSVEPATIRRLLKAFGSSSAVWESDAGQWVHDAGIRPQSAERLNHWRTRFRNDQIEEMLLKNQIHCVVQGDETYPAALYDLPDNPFVLFAKGNLGALRSEPSIAIVGTRRASAYGLEASAWIAGTCARAGCTVISGLALGIDAAAHRAALNQSGTTIAVLGSGVDVCYPPSHVLLYEQIANRGLLLSEYCPRALAQKHRFPTRNRLIAALANAVVVVQAGEKSGALRTVDAALEIGREVYAVPGPITSIHFRGSHQLIQQGAQILLDPKDMLRDFHLEPPTPAREQVPERWKGLYDSITDTQTADGLARRFNVPIQTIYAGLLELELEGLIRKQPGGLYIKT